MKDVIPIAIVVVIVIGVLLIWRRAGRTGEQQVLALVAWQSSTRTLTRSEVESVVERELGIPSEGVVTESGGLADALVPGKCFYLTLPQGEFLVMTQDGTFVEDLEQAMVGVGNERQRETFLRHRAWMTVDWSGDELDGEAKRQAYRTIGKLMAGLLDEECLMLFCPELRLANIVVPETPDQLRSEDPLAWFEWPSQSPIQAVPEHDPRMQAATEEARRRWPEFVERFRKGGLDTAVIKAPFEERGQAEYMWVAVNRIDDHEIRGELMSDPHWLRETRKGDSVRVEITDLNDWLFEADGEVEGGFTQQAMLEIAEEQHRGDD